MGEEVQLKSFGGVSIPTGSITDVIDKNGEKLYSVRLKDCIFTYKEQTGSCSLVHYDNGSKTGVTYLTNATGVNIKTSDHSDNIVLEGCQSCMVDLTPDDGNFDQVFIKDSENQASKNNKVIFEKKGIEKGANGFPLVAKDQAFIHHLENFHEKECLKRYNEGILLETEEASKNTASYTWREFTSFLFGTILRANTTVD